MWRTCALALAALGAVLPLAAGEQVFPAPSGGAGRELVIYSSLDAPLAGPLVEAFQQDHPEITVRYHDLLSGEIADRVVAETEAGGPTADFVFSSAMDLQVKLANDGYARPVQVAEARGWPRWANWRDTAFALTFEPAVIVYHRPSFPDGPPDTRLRLMDWLAAEGPAARVGTYDIEASAVGYLFLARDEEHFPDVWSLIAAMGQAGLQVFPTSQDIIDRVTDGRLAIGYNILGSYAAEQARHRPDLGLVLPRDFTVVVSRVALVPRAAASPDLGAAFLGFMMSAEGQTVLSTRLGLPGISAGGGDGAQAMLASLGGQLRPVGVSPGLLVYLDQAKRRRMLARWAAALGR